MAKRPAPRVFPARPVSLPTEGVPRHWFLGSALLTHLNNAMFVLFPEGERYFVRRARRTLARVARPELRAEVEAFIAQEAQHAREHRRFLAVYEAQGLPVKPVVDKAAALLDRLDGALARLLGEARAERLGLAMTAASEHYTASWGAQVFGDLSELDGLDPTMRTLLLWHFAEELEHKHVAFELLKSIDDRYALRAAGMVLSTAALGTAIPLVAVYLMRADGQLDPRRLGPELLVFLRHPDNLVVSGLKSFARYLRPGFHPDEIPHAQAARDWLDAFEADGFAVQRASGARRAVRA